MGGAALTGRYVVGLVFLAAALPKLIDRREFQRAVANYALLPRPLVAPMAAWLPRLELTFSLLLLLGVAVTPVAASVAALLLVFSLAVAINLARGKSFSCGCFSTVAPRKIGWGLVSGDLALAGVAVLVAVRDPGVLALAGRAGASPLTAGDGVAGLLLATTLVVVYLLASSWISLRAASRSAQKAVA